MKSIINSEIMAVKDYEQFAKDPYQNSDFSIGRIVRRSDILRNFLENLLLYDRIYIVTKSFDEIVLIKEWLGEHNFLTLLHEGAVKFIQVPFAWAYIQKWKHDQGLFKTQGIVTISLADEKSVASTQLHGTGEPDETHYGGWSDTDIEKGVSYTLTKFYKLSGKKVSKLSGITARNTTQLRSEGFRGFITTRSEEDLKNPAVLKDVGLSEKTDILNIPDNSDEIRKLFRIILANQNIAIMQNVIEADLLAEQYYLDVLRYPLTNELRAKKVGKQAKELFELERIPVPEILGNIKLLSISQVIRLRNSKEGKNFREWIHKNFDAGEDIKAAYVELLKQKPPFVYRLISTFASGLIGTGVGAVNPAAGIVTDAGLETVIEFKLNSLVERYLVKNPPRIFMENVKKSIK